MYRQGDVLLVPIKTIPVEAIKQNNADIVILAYGEKTGHIHAIKSEKVAEYKKGEDRYFDISGQVILSHGLREEIDKQIAVGRDHDIVEIPEGRYRLIQQREYTPEMIRRVAD